MSVLIKNLRLETELFAQMCHHTCPLGFLGEATLKLAKQHICSQKLCKYVTHEDWRNIARMVDKDAAN